MKQVVLLLMFLATAVIAENTEMTVHTDKVVGKMEPLWNVRVLNKPELWLEQGYAKNIKESSPTTKIIMNVRPLGGKINRTCEWFKGVGPDGEPICDFKGLIKIMSKQVNAGFTPWIVLDQVPHKMTSHKPNDIYGIVHPADDMKLWYKYVRKTVQALVEKFGIEQVSKWRFRVGTEPDNPEHWDDTKEKYFEHYDYTVAAVESVIKDPVIGPGNFLMVRSSQQLQKQKKEHWTFDILRHCAEGKNYYTGKKGTRISFYAQSCYAASGQKFPYKVNMEEYHKALSKFPSLKGLPHEIHEYGEIKSIRKRGPFVSLCEWNAGFFAQTIDLAYQYGTEKVFLWDGHDNRPRGRVLDCLNEMEGGERFKVTKPEEKRLSFGTISSWKDNTLYLLVYSHDAKVSSKRVNNISLKIKGTKSQSSEKWSLSESLLDKNNGVAIYSMYKDIEAAGIQRIKGSYSVSPFFLKYDKSRFKETKEILKKNKDKYEGLSRMTQISTGKEVQQKNGELNLNLKLTGSGIYFIKLKKM